MVTLSLSWAFVAHRSPSHLCCHCAVDVPVIQRNCALTRASIQVNLMTVSENYTQALIRLLDSTDLESDEKQWRIETLSRCAKDASENPRTEGRSDTGEFPERTILAITLDTLRLKCEQLYGKEAEDVTNPYPFYWGQDHSQIRILRNHEKPGSSTVIEQPAASEQQASQAMQRPEYVVTLNIFATTWDKAFYEIAHETVHTLNPSLEPTTFLDEGVAVKFAESMHLDYIQPYTDQAPPLSPLTAHRIRFGTKPAISGYVKAYEVARKIPDEILRRVREAFGGFPFAKTAERLFELCDGHITLDEAAFLCSEFSNDLTIQSRTDPSSHQLSARSNVE